MTDEQFQILCAAILQTVGGSRGHYSGSAEELATLVLESWPGAFSEEDILDGIEFLAKINIAEKSTFLRRSMVAINHPVAMRRLQNGSGMPSHPMRIVPLLHEYAKFGEAWLQEMWPTTMARSAEGNGGDVQPLDVGQDEGAITTSSVDSSGWTGLPPGFVPTEEKWAALRLLLREADETLNGLGASNSEKAMARAYIVAAKSLADAPEPQLDLVWEIISRANQISGVASLFVSIIALFTAAAH